MAITTEQRRQAHILGQNTDVANYAATNTTLPELVTLTQFGWSGGSADIADPLQAALDHLAANYGGVVKLPGGNLYCSKGIVVRGCSNNVVGINTGITIEGAGPLSTIIAFTAPVSVGFDFNPSPPTNGMIRGGGIRDLMMMATGGGSTGIGIHFGAVLLPAVENVSVYGFSGAGGIGVKFGDIDIDNNYVVQQLQCNNLYVNTCETGVVVNGVNQGTFVGLRLDQNTQTCLQIKAGSFSIEGLLLQGDYTNGILVDARAVAAVIVNVGGFCYVESTSTSNVPVVKVNDNFSNNGTVLFSANLVINDNASAGPVFDLARCTFVLQGIADLRKPHPWIKGRNMRGLTVHNFDVNDTPTADLFDLDAASETVLNFIGFGTNSLGKIPQGQAAQLLGVGLQLARVSSAAENTSLYGGAVTYAPDITPVAAPATLGALRVLCENGVYRTVAFDPDSWYSILSPYAGTGELWWADNNIAVSAWTGMVQSFAFTQGTGADQPTIVTSAAFNNKQVLRFTRAGNQVMTTGDVGKDIWAATDLYPYCAMLCNFRNYNPDPGYEQDPLAGDNGDDSLTPLQIRLLAGEVQGRVSRASTFVPQSNVAVPNNTAVLLEWWLQADGIYFALNYNGGTYHTAGTANDTALRKLYLGGWAPGTDNADLDIRGLAILPSKPADSVRQALFKFCQTDSGI